MTLQAAARVTQGYMLVGLIVLVGAGIVGSNEDLYAWGLCVVWVGPLLGTLLHAWCSASSKLIAVIACIWILLAVAIGMLIQKGQV